MEVLLSLDDALLKPLVGCALLLAGLSVVAKPDLRLSPAGERVAGPIAGALADAGLSLVYVLPVMLGMVLGTRIRPRVPIRLFRLLILLVVFAGAIDLIVAHLLKSLA